MKPYQWLVAEIDRNPNMTMIHHNHTGMACMLKVALTGHWMRIIASWEGGWDHVSVSLPHRLPKYGEMKAVKKIFFEPHEWAIEYHPAEDDYISVNDNVLHLWRPQNVEIPKPPKAFV